MKTFEENIAELLLQDLTDFINTNDSIQKIDDLSNALCWICSNYGNSISNEFQSILFDHIISFRVRSDYEVNFVFKLTGMLCALNALNKKDIYMHEVFSMLGHHNSSIRISALGSIFSSGGTVDINNNGFLIAAEEHLVHNYAYKEELIFFLIMLAWNDCTYRFNEMFDFEKPAIYNGVIQILGNHSTSSLVYIHEVVRKAKLKVVEYACKLVQKEYNPGHKFEYEISNLLLSESKGIRTSVPDYYINEVRQEVINTFLGKS